MKIKNCLVLTALGASTLLAGDLESDLPRIAPERSIIYPHGHADAVKISNHIAYVNNGWSRGLGMLEFDLSNPNNPRYQGGGLPILGYPTGVLFYRNAIYQPTRFGLVVAEKLPSGKAQYKSNFLYDFPIGAPITNCVIAGNFLLASSGDGVRVLNLEEPLKPLLWRFYDEMPPNVRLAAQGDIISLFTGNTHEIYRIDRDGNLHLLTKKNYRQPIRRTGLLSRTTAEPLAFTLSGNTLDCWDIQDLAGKKSTLGNVKDFFICNGDIPVVIQTAGRLGVLDKSSLPELKVQREIKVPELGNGTFEFDGKNYYYIRERVLQIFSAGEAEAQLLATIPMLGEGYLEFGDNTIYLSGESGRGMGLAEFDLSGNQNDGKIYRKVAIIQPEPAENHFIYYNHVSSYAMTKIDNFLIAGGALFELAGGGAAKYLRHVMPPSTSMELKDGLLFAACGKDLVVGTVADLPEFKILSRYRSSSAKPLIYKVKLYKNSALILDGETLEILDVTKPEAIQKLTEISVKELKPYQLLINNNYLYIPGSVSGGLRQVDVYDISNLKSPKRLGRISNLIDFGVSAAWQSASNTLVGDGGNIVEWSFTNDPLQVNKRRIFACDISREQPDTVMNYTDIKVNGNKLYGKKYPQIDVWPLTENMTGEVQK